MRAIVLLAATASVVVAANAQAQPPPAGDDRFRQLMEQAKARSAGQAPVSGALSEERQRERLELLSKGESALASLDVEAALATFDRASSILHAADTELGLVRTYLQGGEYRRALAFVSHTAAAHRDVSGGSALYAWLLHAGGQRDAAQRLLAESAQRLPGDALLEAVKRELSSSAPRVEGAMLQAPARFAPYARPATLPTGSRVAGTGLLVDAGHRVLVPARTVGSARTVWVRNGVGEMSRASVVGRLPGVEVAQLKLDRPIAVSTPVVLAPADPFPGSPGITIEYAPSTVATPGWPILTVGFLGMPLSDSPYRRLGIELPRGPRGGPVFDKAGRLAGLSLPAEQGDRLVPLSALRLSSKAGVHPTTAMATSVPIDQIYEAALASVVQVIVAR